MTYIEKLAFQFLMQETLSWKFEDKESYKWCLEFRAALSGVKALLGSNIIAWRSARLEGAIGKRLGVKQTRTTKITNRTHKRHS